MFNFSQSQTYVDFDNDRTIIRKLKRTRRTMKSILSYCPGFGFLDDQQLQRNAATHRMDVRASAIAEFQRESVLKFQIRKSLIERQLTLIFIYPAAYVFLWLAPLALQCLQYNYMFTHGIVFWIGAVAAFMQPFNCVIDTIAFMIRERPWRMHKERIFTKENGAWVKRRLTFDYTFDQNNKTSNIHADIKSSASDDSQKYDLEGEKSTIGTNARNPSTSAASGASRSFNSRENTYNTDISIPISPKRVQSLYPFASTARRFIPESIDDDEDNDDDGEEIDLMEFLGA